MYQGDVGQRGKRAGLEVVALIVVAAREAVVAPAPVVDVHLRGLAAPAALPGQPGRPGAASHAVVAAGGTAGEGDADA